MKKLIVSMFLVFALVAVNIGVATAAADEAKKAPSPAQLAHQDKMKLCNKEASAKALKGDERKAFMKNCLSGKAVSAPAPAPATATKMTQQDKMKSCNKDAKEKALKGDEREKFMSECLKK
jgi:hypothetical protein